ncbi:MAG TPA: PIG-L family deacetylase, partial [Dongiaceae bacterium]|nr:PIG-L family deacetylase [Dongiaceae bacterium]
MSFPQVGRRAWNRAGGLATGAWLSACLTVSAQMTPSAPAAHILQDLNQFSELGSVLYVAAHPDDENNQLIAYLARGRNYRTAYLSLTRGDGGQNVLGPQFGSELGVIRTEELLAARRVDGGRQYFSRAVDFGFSKDYQETLNIWDRPAALSDIVRVIREFRPDVVINRFSTVPGGTHGHHTASAVLDTEAFKLAGDPQAFPEQLREGLTPWQPKRLFWNAGGFQRGGAETNVIRLNVGGVDAVTGESFADIAGHSRSMHKTQGFGNYPGGGGRGPREESFVLLAGDPATNDIMDGVDTTWDRVPGGAAIASATTAVIAKFNPQDPAANVPALLKIKKDLEALPHPDPVVDEKRALLDRIIQACLGLTVTTTVPQADVVPGEPLQLHLTAQVQSAAVPVRWVATRYPVTKTETAVNQDLVAGQAVHREATEMLPAGTPVSRPYWLREEPAAGLFHVADLNLIGRPENPPVFPVEQVFEVGGQRLALPDQPVQVSTGSAEVAPRPLIVISPVSLQLQSEVGLFAPKASHPVSVEVTAMRADVTGALHLAAPDGWRVQPATQAIHLRAVGDQTRFTFTVTAPAEPTTAGITAMAEIGGRSYDNERTVVDYPHIPRLVWQPPARL